MNKSTKREEKLMQAFPKFKHALDNGWSINVAMKQAGWNQYDKAWLCERRAEVRDAVNDYVERVGAKRGGMW